MIRVAAALLAAGRSERFGEDKLAQTLRGKPIWRWGFDTLQSHARVDGVGIVCPAGAETSFRAAAPEALFVVAGGGSRTESTRCALQAMPQGVEIVLVHDAARPFVSSALIDRVIDGVEAVGACAPGLPVADTVKERVGETVRTLDRSRLVATQTPQGARREWLDQAFANTAGETTDEMAMLEAAGITPRIVEGDPGNFKLTRPEDWERARSHVGAGETRTGIGYDVHAFSEPGEGVLVLGGEHFEGSPRLKGHSDADALLHAVCDALLGAAALGDIGQHFPNTDPRWKDCASSEFLSAAARMLKERGWRIVNIDATVIAETPQVMGRAESIRGRIASTVGISIDCVSIKATTNEGLGALGRREGIAAFAVATLSGTP